MFYLITPIYKKLNIVMRKCPKLAKMHHFNGFKVNGNYNIYCT